MAVTKEVLDELLKGCRRPDDFYGPDGLVKQLSKALIGRMMEAERENVKDAADGLGRWKPRFPGAGTASTSR